MAVRRYQILGVLGRGGFGTVYRAALRAGDGFHRQVALKILQDAEPDPEVLARFRDEARVLGRLRHANIPGVGPPVRIGGRWAVVMDLVDGVDCHRLLRRLGALPLRCALEVVGEVAGTLQQLHTALDEDARPMNLVHRDVKPSNIMLTPGGRVALLDFGNAKATFDAREARTTDHVGGTVGYIPPERVEGQDGPPGDIYSLGVVLHLLVTGEKPPPITSVEVPGTDVVPSLRGETLELARRMRSLNPLDRPTAAEVEGTCRRMALRVAGLALREWAGGVVPGEVNIAPDELVGRTLAEEDQRAVPVRRSDRWMGALAVLTALVGLSVCAGAGVVWLAPDSVVVQAPVPRAVFPMRPTPAPPASTDLVALEPGEDPGPGPVREERPAVPVEPVADAPPGRVEVTGVEGRAWLQRGARQLPVGTVSPATYDVYVTFGEEAVHAATVRVRSGVTTRLDCNLRFRRCVERTL